MLLRAPAAVLALVASAVATVASHSSGHAESSLPIEARELFDRGEHAIALRDYALAARYFDEVRKKAPYSPQVLFNQALAEALAGGRDLRAIVLLNAYLAIAPDDKEANSVRDQIERLEVAVESAVDKMLREIPTLTSSSEMPRFPGRALHSDAYLPALMGRDDEARRLAKDDWDAFSIIFAQLYRGDFASAAQAAKASRDDGQRLTLYAAIAGKQGITNPDDAEAMLRQDVVPLLKRGCCALDKVRGLPWADASVATMRGFIISGRTQKAIAIEREFLPLLAGWRENILDHATLEGESRRRYVADLEGDYEVFAHLEAVATADFPKLVRPYLPQKAFTLSALNDARIESADWLIKRGDLAGATRLLGSLQGLSTAQTLMRQKLLVAAQSPSASETALKRAIGGFWTTYLDSYLQDATSYTIPSDNVSEPYDVLSLVEDRAEYFLKWLWFAKTQAPVQVRLCRILVCEAKPPE